LVSIPDRNCTGKNHLEFASSAPEIWSIHGGMRMGDCGFSVGANVAVDEEQSVCQLQE
jgi:hypothetical protein